MTDVTHFPLQAGGTSSPAPELGAVAFGTVFSDHMVRARYSEQRWHDPAVTRLEPLTLQPHAACLHYGQTVFEGLKAFRQVDGSIAVFRPERHAQRFRASTDQLCMPAVSVQMFCAAVEALVRVDQAWVSAQKNSALYIRPTMIATEPFLGVRPSREYLFFVFACPVTGYYAKGFAPVRIWIESERSRAASGGLGSAKTGANYVASMLAAEKARERGYDQVLWTDSSSHTRVEEVGTMNVFVRLRDRVVTPKLTGTLLDGVTRDCVIQTLKDWRIPIEERELTVEELVAAGRNGDLLEVFGTGTGAVISPVSHLGWQQGELVVGTGEAGELSNRLFDHLSRVQRGESPDTHHWLKSVV
ncbi:MAG: branched-chain amino acid aminotransferase [Pseudomonadota bacterium]